MNIQKGGVLMNKLIRKAIKGDKQSFVEMINSLEKNYV